MKRLHLIVALAIPFLASGVACDTAVAPSDDGSEDDSSSTSGAGGHEEIDCSEPDTTCPGALPYPGSPCAGALACDYGDDVIPWHFTCEAGRWAGGPDCSMLGGACGIFPEAEGCADTFSGQLSAAVEIGPAVVGEPFRAFEDGEVAAVEWGQQGLAMVHFRLRIDSDSAPSCIMTNRRIAPAGMDPYEASSPVTLRCGESLRMYLILPPGDCTVVEPVETTLQIDVAGIGTGEARVMVPPEGFCRPTG